MSDVSYENENTEGRGRVRRGSLGGGGSVDGRSVSPGFRIRLYHGTSIGFRYTSMTPLSCFDSLHTHVGSSGRVLPHGDDSGDRAPGSGRWAANIGTGAGR